MKSQDAVASGEGPFEALKKELNASALFAATGVRDQKGAVSIGVTLASIGIPDLFVEGYKELAQFDVVGMLFAADPRIAERLSARQYEVVPTTVDSHTDLKERLKIQAYLRKANFEHLVLAGLDSKLYGMAWVVAYRGPKMSPASAGFTDEELEFARYKVPSVLFNVLRDRAAEKPAEGVVEDRAVTGVLVPLDARRLRIAILEAEGFGASVIAERVHRHSVNNDLTEIRERLGVKERRITLRDLEHYADRCT